MSKFARIALAALVMVVLVGFVPAWQVTLWSVHDGISLNFATGVHYVKAPGQAARYGAFTDLFTFTRNSVGTYRAQSGLLAYANENATHHSDDATQVSGVSKWFDASTGTTTRTGGQADPWGGTTATKLVGNNANTWWLSNTDLGDATTQHIGRPITASIWMRVDSNTSIDQKCSINGAANQSQTQSVTTTWARYSFTFIGPQGTAGSGLSCGVNVGNGVNVYVAGAQVQRGAIGPNIVTGATGRYDQPRIEYDVSGNALGLLVEGARTNFALDFKCSAGFWGCTNVTDTQDGTLAPDGSATAWKIAATASASTVLTLSTASVGSASGNTYCVFSKQGTGANTMASYGLRNGTTATNLIFGSINYSTGVWTYSTGSTGVTVAGYANSWWRICISAAAGISAGDTIAIYATASGAVQTAGDFAYVWGPMLEAGPFGSSYVPTSPTVASMARAADSATRSLGSEYNQIMGSMFSELLVAAPNDVFNSCITLVNGATNTTFERIRAVQFAATGFTRANSQVQDAGALQADFSSTTVARSTPFKTMLAWQANDYAAYTDGAQDGVDTSGTVGTTVTDLQIVGGSFTNDVTWIKRIDYYPTRMPNGFLQFKTLPGKMSANDNDAQRRAYG